VVLSPARAAPVPAASWPMTPVPAEPTPPPATTPVSAEPTPPPVTTPGLAATPPPVSADPAVIGAAKALLSALEEVAARIEMAKVPRDHLESCLVGTREIIAKLTHVHENLVPLAIKKDERPLAKARQAWNALPFGKVKADGLEIIQVSPSLATMFKAGLNFKDFYRYSEEEFRLATDMGRGFEEWNLVWFDFKETARRGEQRIRFSRKEYESFRGFMRCMKQHGVIQSYDFFRFSYGKPEKMVNPDRQVPSISPGAQLGVEFAGVSTPRMEIVNGHWLTAFVYKILDDHLSRNEFDYEIYSRVRYVPADMFTARGGDFDVLARSQGRILAVECKSGALRENEADNRHDLEEVADIAKNLQGAFAATRSQVKDISFWLVYNPFANKADDVSRRLQDTGVRPLLPKEIRGAVTDHFRGS
jgi:hypothetical protein